MKRRIIFLLIIVLIFTSIFLYNSYIEYKVDKENPVQKTEYRVEKRKFLDDEEIALAAQYYVKENLASPNSAKFQPLFKVKVMRDNFIYTVSSFVDSQNGFGAMIRSNYKVIFKQTENGKFKLIELKIK